MKQFTIHGATHFQRKACVKNAMRQQAPPNVISFVKNEADFKKDLENLEKWLKEAPAWSQEKHHYLHLLAMITKRSYPDKIVERHHACYMLCKHGDAAKAVGKFYGVDAAEEIKKALGWKW